jgi:hypothetical protein
MALSKDEWTLLAIAKAGDQGLTPAQLQKTLYLLKKSYSRQLRDFYKFIPYNYGPFDKTIYSDAAKWADLRLVETNGVLDQSWSVYCITEQGKQKASELAGNATTAQISYLNRVVQWAQSLSFQELIASIYKRYPEYKVNSVFRD